MIKTKHKQTEIAKRTGVSQPTISNWLKMNSKPTGLTRKAVEELYPDLIKRIDEEWAKIEQE